MPSEDANLIIEKLNAVRGQGDTCMGMVFGKTPSEWKSAFSQAAQILNIAVETIEPLANPVKPGDTANYIASLTVVFQKSAGQDTLILAEVGRNESLNQDDGMEIADHTETLAHNFPKAIFVQIVKEAQCATAVNFYCMNPKVARDPHAPIHPV